jgi:GT2 family glycosyltransferase
MKLSVVIPTHDTRELALAAVASILRQPEGGSVDLVVVDDGSGDGTAEAVRRSAPAARLLRHEEPRGFTPAANAGLAAAQGDVLLLLNSDAELRDGALAALAVALAAEPGLGVAGARLFYPDGRPQWSGGRLPSVLWLFALASGVGALRRRLPGAGGTAAGHARPVEWVSGAALAMRRAVWEGCGPLDGRYAFYGQDLDLCWAARRAGFGVAVVPRFTAVHHHGATIGRDDDALGGQRPELLWPDLLRCIEKYRGAIYAARARRALRLGVWLRLAARRLGAPFARDRGAHARASATLAAARAALLAGE